MAFEISISRKDIETTTCDRLFAIDTQPLFATGSSHAARLSCATIS